MIGKEDLEGLIQHMTTVARERGLKPEELVPVVTEAATRYNRAQEGEISNIYSSLANEPWFVRAFQMGTKLHRMRYINEDEVRNSINRVLGTNLSDRDRGEYGNVYVVLEKTPPQVKVETPTRKWYSLSRQPAREEPPQHRQAKLYSYGQAHEDPGGRRNYHHFVVEGDYTQLQTVLQSFVDNPSNLRQFVSLAFGWKNEEAKEFDHGSRSQGSQSDLFRDMKRLITYSPERGAHQQVYTPKV